jgi:hypothetical protein
MWDLAYMAWTWGSQTRPPLPLADQARRLRALRDGYGAGAAEELVAAVVARQRGIAEAAAQLLRRPGEPPAFYAQQRGAIAWADADREHVKRHAQTLVAALRR